jgi:hypothetical protein
VAGSIPPSTAAVSGRKRASLARGGGQPPLLWRRLRQSILAARIARGLACGANRTFRSDADHCARPRDSECVLLHLVKASAAAAEEPQPTGDGDRPSTGAGGGDGRALPGSFAVTPFPRSPEPGFAGCRRWRQSCARYRLCAPSLGLRPEREVSCAVLPQECKTCSWAPAVRTWVSRRTPSPACCVAGQGAQPVDEGVQGSRGSLSKMQAIAQPQQTTALDAVTLTTVVQTRVADRPRPGHVRVTRD